MESVGQVEQAFTHLPAVNALQRRDAPARRSWKRMISKPSAFLTGNPSHFVDLVRELPAGAVHTRERLHQAENGE